MFAHTHCTFLKANWKVGFLYTPFILDFTLPIEVVNVIDKYTNHTDFS